MKKIVKPISCQEEIGNDHSKNYVNRSVLIQKIIKSIGSRVYLATLSYSHLGEIVMCDT